MLRMYECNWCWQKQVIDDGAIVLVPDPERMVMHKRAKCAWNCRAYIENFKPIMHPMYKDKDGDWHREWDNKSRNKFKRSEQEVVPQMTWH